MLRIPRIDKVVLTLQIAPEWFFVVRNNLIFVCIEYGYKWHMKYVLGGARWNATINIGQQRLWVTIWRVYKSYSIHYSFNGEIDIAAFQESLLLLSEYGLSNACAHGRIKRLELAVDFPGLHTSKLICHSVGMHTSNVQSNAAGTGATYYLGSLAGSRQFAVYDKNQELRDKGKDPGPGDLLRVELRLYKTDFSLAQAFQYLEQSDPFEGFRLAYRTEMFAKATKIGNWALLIGACIQEGTPKALKAFPEQKKTLLNHLKKHHLHAAPRLNDFSPALARIRAQTKSLYITDQIGLPLQY